jgi:hypothetical protein
MNAAAKLQACPDSRYSQHQPKGLIAADLVVATYQVHMLGVLNLERQQQADGLQ